MFALCRFLGFEFAPRIANLADKSPYVPGKPGDWPELRQQREIDDSLIPQVAPLGWNHINLTGDYAWHANKRVAQGRFRPLRVVKSIKLRS